MDRQQERTDRHQQLAAEVAARLRPACAHLPEAAFSELVQDIARMKVRFREIDAQTSSGKPSIGSRARRRHSRRHQPVACNPRQPRST